MWDEGATHSLDFRRIEAPTVTGVFREWSAGNGTITQLSENRTPSMAPKRHHRCNLCGKDCETGAALKDHVERRHPKKDVRWWVVVEDPAKDLKFSR